MSEKLMLINADQPEECRAVILDNGKIEEFIVEHAEHEQIKGNIYLGVIHRVEPSIEAAFVDIGAKKYGFLPFKDVLRESYMQTGEKKARVRIQDVLVRGQKILVQVAKEGRDAKGPSLSNSISLPGRFLVLMNGAEGSAISRKIEDEAERKKLKSIISSFKLPENLGLIIRTAGLGRTKAELHKDLQMLLNIWNTIEESVKSKEKEPPFLIYQEANMVTRAVRDHFTNEMKEIIVDSPDAYNALLPFLKLIMPRSRNIVRLYQDPKPLFSRYKIEEQIESIYHRRVELPSGGSLVIDVGEAMVSIDVNSGKTTGASALEETATKTNLEAAEEVARQLRLRDLGGLIVIDFIDMFQKRNKANVEKQLKKACKQDKARINISRISKFGLMEMSRQRISPPVKEGVFEQCPHCEGTGHVRSLGSTVLQVLRKIGECITGGNVKELTLEISPEVGGYLFNEKAKFLLDLQEKEKFTLKLMPKVGLEFEDFQYNVVGRTSEEKAALDAGEKERTLSADVEKGEKRERPARTRQTGPRRPKSAQRKRYTRKPSGTRTRRPPQSRGPIRRTPRPAAAKAGENIQPLEGSPGNESAPAAPLQENKETLFKPLPETTTFQPIPLPVTPSPADSGGTNEPSDSDSGDPPAEASG